jgi:hypothetical protein
MATGNYPSVFALGIKQNLDIEYKETPSKADTIFHAERTNSRYEDVVKWEGYPRPGRRNPGEYHASASFAQSFGFRIVIAGYGFMDAIPDEDMKDAKYDVFTQMIPGMGGAAARAFRTNEELLCAEFMQNGYSNSTGLGTFDGTGLISTAHPLSLSQSATTVVNRPAADMDISILAADWLYTNMTSQLAANGQEILDNSPAMVVCHGSQRRIAKQVWTTDWEPGTSDRNVNIFNADNVRVMIWPYFRQSGTLGAATNQFNSWFALGSTHQLYKVTREDVDIQEEHDIYTNSQVWTMNHRLAVYALDWRGVAGSSGR